MQQHLGKEVYVAGYGRRGFVVSHSRVDGDTDLLIDFGDGYCGHCGNRHANHPQKTYTHAWVKLPDLKFLTEDDE